MSIEVEFIVQTEAFQHVKLTLSGSDLAEARDESPAMTFEEWMGDYWASMKAGVLYGRDKALLNAKLAAGIEQAKAGQTHDLGDFSRHLEDDPETAHEGAVEALKEGLGATVLGEEEKPAEGPSSPSLGEIAEMMVEADAKPKRPWDKKPAAKKSAAPKAAAKTEAKSDWDF